MHHLHPRGFGTEQYMDNDKILMSEALFEFLKGRVILINYPAGRECEKTVHEIV